MNRPRKNRPDLPPYVYRRRNGLYLYEYDHKLKRAVKPVRLCDSDASPAEVWKIYEKRQGLAVLTLKGLADLFEASPQWVKLSPATQRDYGFSRTMVCACKTETGTLGDLPVEDLTRGVMRQYLDIRMTESASRARHEGRWIKRLYSWAYEREIVPANTMKGLKIGSDPVRKRYVTNKELDNFKAAARKSGSPWLAPYAEICCRAYLRPNEGLKLTDADLTDAGLRCVRGKGSDTNTVRISGRLAEAIEEAKALRAKVWLRRKGHSRPFNPSERFLFIGRNGQPLSMSGMSTAWRRIMATWEPEKRFDPHDMKRKGISDAKGDKRKASGHRTAQMAANYDTKDVIVPPAGEDW